MRLADGIGFRAPRFAFRKGSVTPAKIARADVLLAVSVGDAKPRLPRSAESAARAAAAKDRGDEPDRPGFATLEDGTGVVSARVDPSASAFAALSVLRKATEAALRRNPRAIAVALPDASRGAVKDIAAMAAYVLSVNAAEPDTLQTKKKDDRGCRRVDVYGAAEPPGQLAVAEGNLIARSLTAAPGNFLDPSAFRKVAESVARERGLGCRALGKNELREAGAGAFLAVADSTPKPAFVVVVSHRHPRAKLRVALIGKGVCFDTGGYNIKTGPHMRGMHNDMAGAAAALGATCALARMGAPVDVECWLGLAENHISPEAIRPGDVVRAHSGKTVEIVDTDAEGRLILADLLSMAGAGRRKPQVAVTFATLTGTMVHALGKRYSGLFATRDGHAEIALKAGHEAGERLCRFPMDEDYHKGLESKVADILQCSKESEADHILAARFLREFVPRKASWLHVDLAAAVCPDGLGAVSAEVNGFGVRWAAAFVRSLCKGPRM